MPDAKQAKQMFYAESRSENICVSDYKLEAKKILHFLHILSSLYQSIIYVFNRISFIILYVM